MTTQSPSLAQRPLVGWPTMFLYGVGAVANAVKGRGLAMFLMVYYNQVLGLPAAWVGLGTAIALVVDAFVDPAVGYISDNTRGKWGRRHPFMYAAALPVAVLFYLIWNPPAGLSQPALFAYMMVCLLSIRVFDTFFELPASALAPELEDDYDRRTKLIAVRTFLAVLGGFGMTALAYQVFMRENADGSGGVLARDGYFSYSVAGAVIIFVTILIASISTHRFIPWLKSAPRQRLPVVAQFGEILSTLKNRAFLAVSSSGMLIAISAATSGALSIYLGLFFWELTQTQLTLIAGVGIFAAALGVMAAPIVSQHVSKRTGALAGYILGVFAEQGPFFGRLIGLMPENGDPLLLQILAACSFVNVFCWTMTGVFLTAMIADVVEDNAVRTGRRSEGLLFAADSLFKKISSAGGPMIAGLLLTAAAFPAGAARGAVDPDVLRTLAFVYMPTMIAFYIVSITLLSFYTIDRKRHAANLAALRDAEARAES